MSDTHLMIGTDDRTLEKAPNAFDAISVNVANNPFLSGVINPLMFRVGVLNSPVSWHFIGVDRFCIRCSVIMDKLVQRCFVGVRNNLQSNLAFALYRSDSDSFIALVTASHPAHLASDVGFIDFDNASKKLTVNLTHGCTDAMAEIPSRFVSDAKRPLHLEGAHSLF